MGRYYTGDIDGKFWFAVQSSNAADQFGAEGHATYISYYFDEGHIPDIEQGLKKLSDRTDMKKCKEYFKANQFYQVSHASDNGISEDNIRDYADYELGKEILDCVVKNGQCSFEAEL